MNMSPKSHTLDTSQCSIPGMVVRLQHAAKAANDLLHEDMSKFGIDKPSSARFMQA